MKLKVWLGFYMTVISYVVIVNGQNAGAPSQVTVLRDEPLRLATFIRTMMTKYGETKAAEALQSLDQLPLGLIMKVLLVEVDKSLAADIVEMQQYAQNTDKALIQMIGRIVAGDKNVPKEIFAMDQKLMKFPWWMRIRQRMFTNLEKYIAAYSLVPVAAKAAINGASGGGTSSSGLETPAVPETELTAAVAASATEKSKLEQQQQVLPVASVTNSHSVEAQPPLRISLLTPIQQQQILETLALASAGSLNAGVQQAQQPSNNGHNRLTSLSGILV